jgi:hypothetical protein
VGEHPPTELELQVDHRDEDQPPQAATLWNQWFLAAKALIPDVMVYGIPAELMDLANEQWNEDGPWER